MLGEATAVMQKVRGVSESYAPKTGEKEAQTEHAWVRPVLEALGHDAFEVQPSLKVPGSTQTPDYVLYPSAAARDAAGGKVLDEDAVRAAGAYAVGDAKRWDRPLDVALKEGKDPFDNRNPSYQISFYMQHSGVEWGILTNGRLWRLYHRESAYKLDRFYEADLPALLEGNDPEAFLYFYAFFRRAAFDEGAPLSAKEVLRGSVEYSLGVGDALKGQVYEALRHLAQGFLDHPRNGLSTDEKTLAEVQDNALILLYRLLFVLYAEARDLLPVRANTQYREYYGLYAIKHDAASGIESGRPLLPGGATLWYRLKELFGIIDAGSPPLGVATFNGGLFDPERHPFLESCVVGDAHLRAAVDRLARVGGRFVDYRDLAERHLGTIYEGLLEYHLEGIPPEDGWTVALVNESGERKATGSYYTPDYVVKYIVEATVGPVLEEAVAGAKGDREKVEAVLALNVLDPAMGSGHFLVEVTEYIARFLVELGVARDGDAGVDAETDAEAELQFWKRRVAQSCVYGVDLNPLAVELAKLSLWLATVARDRPLSFLDHHLRCGNSLVGADVSVLAPVGGKGGRKKAKKVDDAQLSMLEDDAFRRSVSTAVGSMWLIEESPADTAEEVKEQEKLYARLRESLTRRYARLADLSTATSFGVEVDGSMWRPLADYASGRVAYAPPRFDEWLDAAGSAARERRFFHWELEFPEVFFDRQGRPLGEGAGFDAVVGNPPYVRQEALGPFKPYLARAYPETYHGVADLYVYFYEQGLRRLRVGGRMSYIVTNKWLRAGYGEPLRGFFSRSGALEEIVDFGHAPIFPDADVFPCIVVLKRQAAGDGSAEETARVVEFPREALNKVDLATYVEEHAHRVPKKRFGSSAWSLEASAVSDLMEKIRERGIPLAEYAGVKPYRGVLTGLNEAFLIDTATKDRLVREDPRSAEVIKPYLRGQDIKRWSPEWRGLWIVVLKSSGDHAWPWSGTDNAEEVFQRTYPALHSHMKPLEEKLRKRKDKGRYWWELRSCAYYDAFERPKIMYQEIQFHSQYGLDTSGLLTNNKGFFLSSNNLWIPAVLNSPLMWWHNWRHLPHMKDEALSPVGVLMEKLPIASPTDKTRAEAEDAVGRLVSITRSEQEARRDLLDWLRVEYGVEKPGGKLEDYARLEPDAFVAEVRKRRPKSEGPLTPARLKALRAGYEETAEPVREGRTEAARLEARLSELVNAAYGLTTEEVDLLWSTAPPRMPRF
ncbi:Eco57I restriction-modification methylase domain-containing protein [Rubrobacter marinus]|uniref:Eco57I restriction-modification methylase domain-containing protein n=1 Tax=Rubrobacter marinus TaxID=2653852 RepID=UPI00140D7013|nr:Eco57I restriction-modification methylase domain-containing protein [Rubrobacter marinus]